MPRGKRRPPDRAAIGQGRRRIRPQVPGRLQSHPGWRSVLKILKSGFSLERCQLRDGCRLKRYITLKCILAWRIFWLTRICKINKSYSCEKVVTKKEWKILHKKFNKNIPLPKKPPSVEEVFIWIGKLGGFIGRKSDGMPGVVSLWRGWMRFMDLVEDYEAFCG